MTPLPLATQQAIARLSAEGIGATDIARRLGVSRGSALRYGGTRLDVPGQTPAPFGPGPRPPANPPPNAWNTDQPPAPPERVVFREGYHDRTFRAFAQPLGFDGWTVERIRNAIAQHDIGIFIESSMLTVTVRRFGPVFAALAQAIAPILALPREVLGGTRGFSRVAAEEITAQLAPRQGLLPSPYFPPTLWGAMAIEYRMMGFAVLQHVYGDPDPITGVRPVYTRRWPTWAVNYYPARRTFVALTDSGPVDIISGDGKFTLVADSDEPHFDGAIRALGLEVLAGVLGDQSLSSYVDRYGNPKLWATMPPDTATRSPAGDDFFEALATLQGPNGYGALPYGSVLQWAQLSASQSTMFKDLDEKITRRCVSILLGTDGTVSSGTGGVYLSPTYEGVARTNVARTLSACVRAVNLGHVAPFLSLNYAATIAETRGWVEPVLSIPLPDPNADARRAAYAARSKERTDILAAERAAGLDVTQERVDQLSAELGLQTIALAAVTPAPAPSEEPDAPTPPAPEEPADPGEGPVVDSEAAEE